MKSLLSLLPGASFRHRISHLNAAWTTHKHTHTYIRKGGISVYIYIYPSQFHCDVRMMLFAYANTPLQCLCHLFAIHEIERHCGYTKMIAATLWGSALLQWKAGEGPERSVIRAKRGGCLFLHHNRATLEFHKRDISDASARHEHAHLHAVFVGVQETKHADFPVNRLHHCTSMTYFQWYFSKCDWQPDKRVTWLTHADHKAVLPWILAETHAVTLIP